MFGFLSDAREPDPWLLGEDGQIDLDVLRTAAEGAEPVILFSTALALLHLLEVSDTPLPPGSWIFQTGGYKGLAERYDPRELYSRLEAVLGVPPARVINEYGMTELSSQSYAVGLEGPHHSPPWMRVRVLDPETGEGLPPGRTGYLVFYDLANLGSVLAVRTQDFGVAIDEHTFTLRGRDPGALPRGCSRASDAFLQTQ